MIVAVKLFSYDAGRFGGFDLPIVFISTYAAVVALDAPINLDENWLAKKLNARPSRTRLPSDLLDLH